MAIEKFFGQYLASERNASSNTIRSYRDTFLLLIEFFKSELNISVEKITLEVIDRTLVCTFLDWLEKTKGTRFQQGISDVRYFVFSSLTSCIWTLSTFHNGNS